MARHADEGSISGIWEIPAILRDRHSLLPRYHWQIWKLPLVPIAIGIGERKSGRMRGVFFIEH
jgi:hypothetical protein